MKYIMRAGTLYFNDIVSARIKGAFIGSGKKIYSAMIQYLCTRI